jgi:dolichol kinase
MIGQILITFLLLLGFIGILVASEYLHKRYGFPSEVTRKGAHVTATLASFILLYTIESHWYILILGIFFFFLLFIGRKKGLFNSIDAVNRKTGGSYLLPVAIYTSFLVAELSGQTIYFSLPMLLVAICDSLAGYLGICFGKKTAKIPFFNVEPGKTYLGSGAFLLSALVISFAVLFYYQYSGSKLVIWAVIIALATTVTEMVSSRGSDNLTVPWMAMLLIWLSSIY